MASVLTRLRSTKQPGDPSAADLGVVARADPVADRLAARRACASTNGRYLRCSQACVKSLTLSMIIEWCARQVKSSGTHAQRSRPLELGDVGDRAGRRRAPDRRGRSRSARSAPHRIGREPHRRASAGRRARAGSRASAPAAVVGPAVIRAGQAAALDRAERELELAVRAAVLHRAQARRRSPRNSAIERFQNFTSTTWPGWIARSCSTAYQ